MRYSVGMTSSNTPFRWKTGLSGRRAPRPKPVNDADVIPAFPAPDGWLVVPILGAPPGYDGEHEVHAYGYGVPTGDLVHRLMDCDERAPWDWLLFAPEYDWGSIGAMHAFEEWARRATGKAGHASVGPAFGGGYWRGRARWVKPWVELLYQGAEVRGA